MASIPNRQRTFSSVKCFKDINATITIQDSNSRLDRRQRDILFATAAPIDQQTGLSLRIGGTTVAKATCSFLPHLTLPLLQPSHPPLSYPVALGGASSHNARRVATPVQ